MFWACCWDPSLRPCLSTGCLQNALSFWVSILLASALLSPSSSPALSRGVVCSVFAVSYAPVPGGLGWRGAGCSTKLLSQSCCKLKHAAQNLEKNVVQWTWGTAQHLGCSIFCPLPSCQVFRISRSACCELLVPFSYRDTGLAVAELFTVPWPLLMACYLKCCLHSCLS